jgi:hypothetical protein
MSPEEFRKYGHAIVDLIADRRASVAELPVRSAKFLSLAVSRTRSSLPRSIQIRWPPIRRWLSPSRRKLLPMA